MITSIWCKIKNKMAEYANRHINCDFNKGKVRFPLKTHNTVIFNFGNDTSIEVSCKGYEICCFLQTIRIYKGRNLLCFCFLCKECNVQINAIKETEKLVKLSNGKEFINTFILYNNSSNIGSRVPSLVEIATANVYALKLDYLYRSETNLLPKTIIDSPPQSIKQCCNLLCGDWTWMIRDDISKCVQKLGRCTKSKDIDRGEYDCRCPYCEFFDFYPLSPVLKGGGPATAIPVQPTGQNLSTLPPPPSSTARIRYNLSFKKCTLL